MKKNKNNTQGENTLRQKAEDHINKMQNNIEQPPLIADTLKLLHELQVHQIELEMINEELKISRDKAESSAEKFEELYDFAPAGYLTLFRDGTITELNLSAASMLGIDRSRLENKNFRNFISEEALQVFDEHFSKIYTTDTKISFELPLKCIDNSSIFVYVEGKCIGNESKCLISMINITKRKAAEQALNQISLALKASNADLEQFAYAVSHDLQEPLRMISIYAHLLKEDLKVVLENRTEEFMNFIIEGTKRMSSLIQDLLTYSRISSQKKEKLLVDLNNIISDVLKDLHFAILDSKAEITSDQLPVVKANAIQMHQLFQNLIENAIKFRGEKNPVINITVERVGSDLKFCVRDNGIGLNPLYADRIFVIFQQLHSKEEYSGSGIGLSLCKKIVESHGGSIWVESEEGKGAAFYFTLHDLK